MSKRVIVYVDGLNFYNGLKATDWKKYYWLDLVAFFSKFLKPYQTLQGVNYFSCSPSEKEKESRQRQLFLANEIDPRFKVYMGSLQNITLSCGRCKLSSSSYREKESDVRMASRMISDVINNICDISFVVSGDRDFIPAIEAIYELTPDHKIVVFFPPGRVSNPLKRACRRHVDLKKHEQIFTASLLPDEIHINGMPIRRPQKWA